MVEVETVETGGVCKVSRGGPVTGGLQKIRQSSSPYGGQFRYSSHYIQLLCVLLSL